MNMNLVGSGSGYNGKLTPAQRVLLGLIVVVVLVAGMVILVQVNPFGFHFGFEFDAEAVKYWTNPFCGNTPRCG